MLTPSLQKHFEFKIVKRQLLKGNFQHHFGHFNLSTGKAAESSEQNIRGGKKKKITVRSCMASLLITQSAAVSTLGN